MKQIRLSVERSIRIYDDDMGYWVQIAPDRDGMENAEIIYSDGDEKAVERCICLPWPHMVALAKAILEAAERHAPETSND